MCVVVLAVRLLVEGRGEDAVPPSERRSSVTTSESKFEPRSGSNHAWELQALAKVMKVSMEIMGVNNSGIKFNLKLVPFFKSVILG